jgi:hypothetical protein
VRRLTVAAVAALWLLGACGGSGDGDEDASSTSATSARATTTVLAATTTTTTPPSTYRSKEFGVPFTVDLPGGWTVAERDAAAAQLYVLCGSCQHEGEENGEITIGLDLQEVALDEAARQLAAIPRLQASAVEPWSAAKLTGLHFTGTRPGDLGEVRFPDGYHTEATGDPIEVIVLRAENKTVTIIVDSHKAKGDDALDFRAAAATVLANLRFGG